MKRILKKIYPLLLTIFFLPLISQADISLVTSGAVNCAAIDGNVCTLTFPGGIQEGDVVIAYGGTIAGAASIDPTTVGWTEILDLNAGVRFGAWYKVMGSTPDANVQFSAGNSTSGAAFGAYVLRGVETVSVLDATPTTAGPTTSTNPNPAAIVTQTNRAWVIATAGSEVLDTSPGTIASFTNHNGNGANDSFDFSSHGATILQTTAGSRDPGAWSAWASGQWTTITLAIRPLARPFVDTAPVTNVGATTARLNGIITSTGSSTVTQHGFAYSTDEHLTTGVSTSTLGAGVRGEFGAGVTGLATSTPYYFRAYATNTEGTGYGSTTSMTTGDASVPRTFRLFEGSRVKLNQGSRLVLHQRQVHPVTVDVGGSITDTTNLAGSGSWSFTGVDLGDAGDNRTIIMQVVGGFNTDGTIGPPTLNGMPMTLVHDGTPGSLIFQLWAFRAATTTTNANIVVPWGYGTGTLLRFAATMYSVYNLNSIVPVSTDYQAGGSGTSFSSTIGIPKDGIAFLAGRAGINETFTWSDDNANLTINEVFDAFIEATVSHTMAYTLGAVGDEAYTATHTWTTSTASLVNAYGVSLR